MYKIEKNNYGYKLIFGGFIKKDEMQNWVADSKKSLLNSPASFGVFIDMRDLKPLPEDSQQYMVEGQKLYKAKGMKRSVVILSNSIAKMQFQRLAKETGIYEWERYIDASSSSNWEQIGIDWISKQIDPDK